MSKKRTAAFWRQKQYVIAGAVVLAAVIGMTWMYTSRQAKERAEKEQQFAEEAAKAQEEEMALEYEQEETETQEQNLTQASAVVLPQENAQEATEAEVAQEEEKESAPAENTAEKEVAKTQETLHFSVEEGLAWPLQGDVILGFHMDQTVYFATLDQYKYNPAILIAGEVNSKVLAAAQGKITDISQNEVTGCTVTMDLGNGYTAIYGQLKELNFETGDMVEEGQVLGYVSEPTKYFSVEGSNLYFEIQKDGVPQDPTELIRS